MGKYWVKWGEARVLPVVDTSSWEESYWLQIQRLYKFSKCGLIWRCVCKIKYLVWWAISKIFKFFIFSLPERLLFYLFNMLLEHFPATRYLRSVWVLNSLNQNIRDSITIYGFKEFLGKSSTLELKIFVSFFSYLESIIKSE